ncbi:Guanylate kinase [Geodia barretti]|uniref:Guanylate kinase n=2 Tax=Geodia barretti TaxID=519541 RepID=A0AA35R506_GEOBA|nr:Guanylate kinase [Geodia barretti]
MPLIPEASPSPPLLVVLSGPSGVGKDAVLNELRRLDRPWHFAVTATTREMRPGERDGEDYIFIDTDTFARMRERDEFLECAEVYGRWYGVPRSQARDALRSGKDVFLKLDVQGAATIRQMAPEALLIFLIPPSLEDLHLRLRGRMTESDAELERRLLTAEEELAQVHHFDYRVVNPDGDLEQAAADIDAIIAAEKCRVSPRVVQLM